MKRKPTINVHCHLFNVKFVPIRMIKRLAFLPEEDWAKKEWLSTAAGFLFATLPGRKYDRIKEFLETFSSDIDDLTSSYIQGMNEAGIDISIPLMMDFYKTFRDIEASDYPYEKQIELIAQQVINHPWRLFPFVMFDPRRENSLQLCKSAIEEKGFIGVKMYPALGYYPSPTLMEAEGDMNAAKNLRMFYEYCEDKHIPITTHASVGGAYSLKIDQDLETPGVLMEIWNTFARVQEDYVWPFTEVSNWLEPLQTYQIKVNFAHLGGNYFHPDSAKRVQSTTWKNQILNLMATFNKGTVYADLSYHDMALGKDSPQYFQDLKDLLTQGAYAAGVLFGTDASMISHTWSEQDYIQPFKDTKNLDSRFQEMIFSDNPTEFLFNNAQVPSSYCTFLKKSIGAHVLSYLPEWIREENGDYFIVT